jgi:hypothetical protein
MKFLFYFIHHEFIVLINKKPSEENRWLFVQENIYTTTE